MSDFDFELYAVLAALQSLVVIVFQDSSNYSGLGYNNLILNLIGNANSFAVAFDIQGKIDLVIDFWVEKDCMASCLFDIPDNFDNLDSVRMSGNCAENLPID